MILSLFRRLRTRLFGVPPVRREPAPTAFPGPIRVPPRAPAPPPPERGEAEVIGEVEDWVRREVAGGYRSAGEIVADLPDMFEGELDEARLRALAPAMVEAALAAHRRAELGWPAVTDCDRLDAAFAALEEAGIVARQNFSCCGTCGSTEIWDEVDEARAEGRAVRGYGFFHMQDAESAADGHGLYLAYGAVDEGEAAALAVGREIVATLERSGLSTDWDGRWDRRIGVSLDWKRRRAD